MTAHVPERQDTSHRGWLALVIILGVMIVLMMGALIAGLFLNAGRGGAGAPYAAHVSLRSGERILTTQLDGDRILVHVTGGAAGDDLVVLDARSGREIGRVAISATP
jgi:hypothetical protein